MNKDRFNCLTAHTAQVGAFTVLTELDGKLTDEELLAGIATFFLMLCARYNLKPTEILDTSRRRLKDAYSEGRGEHIRAIQNYCQGEL